MKPTRLTLALSLAPLLLPVALLAAHRTQAPKPASAPEDSRAEARKVVAEAIELMKKPGGPVINVHALTTAAESLDKLGDHAGALKTLREARRLAAGHKQFVDRSAEGVSMGPSPASLLRSVGAIQRRLGDKAGAFATLRLAVQVPDREEHELMRLGTLAGVARELAALDAAEDLKEVAKRAEAFYRSLPADPQDEMFLPPLAAIRLMSGDIEGAFALAKRLRTFEESEPARQAVIYRVLISIAENLPTDDRAAGRKLLDRIVENAALIDHPPYRPEILDAIAAAWAKLGNFDAAMRFARQMAELDQKKSYSFPSNSLTSMIEIASIRKQSGDIQGARQTLRQAFEFSKSLKDDQGKSSRLREIATGLISVGDIDGASLCLDAIIEPEYRFDILKQIAIEQRAKGEDAAALATATKALVFPNSIRANPPKEFPAPPPGSTFDIAKPRFSLAGATIQVAEIQAVLGDYATARKTAGTITEALVRGMAYTQIARLQAASGDAKGALAWVRELKEQPQWILHALIEGAAQAKPPAPAVKSSGLMPVPAEGVAMDEGGGRAFSFFIGAYW